MKVIATRDDGTETDITEGVQALFDLVISSMDWGSGFWTEDDARPVEEVARACGFPALAEVQDYIADKARSAEQYRFNAKRKEQGLPFTVMPHDHVWTSCGNCAWPKYRARQYGETEEFTYAPALVREPEPQVTVEAVTMADVLAAEQTERAARSPSRLPKC